MSNYVRRAVSGAKARFRDEDLGVELDLVYITDRIIIMGYPAEKWEALYRNDREDAKKFIEHRHGLNYWVFNLCPLKENSYLSSFFHDHVSRFPFPDHHAPPLATLALATREMHEWLRGDPSRVAVVHCKAGKGRSGTIACSYLLSLDQTPQPPALQRSYSTKEWARNRTDKLVDAVQNEQSSDDEPPTTDTAAPAAPAAPAITTRATDERPLEPKIDVQEVPPPPITEPSKPKDYTTLATDPSHLAALDTTTTASPAPTTPENRSRSPSISLDEILDLHTSRRMKAPSKDGEVKRGVSIPSQRRFLYYWSLVLSNAAPSPFWSMDITIPRPKVHLKSIKVRVRPPTGGKAMGMKMINKVLEKVSKTGGTDKGKGEIWVSLARYDDTFIETLENWEKHSRDGERGFGRRRKGCEAMAGADTDLPGLFKDGKWDAGKMVRRFARLGSPEAPLLEDDKTSGRIQTHMLRPLPLSEWVHLGRASANSIDSQREGGDEIMADSSSTVDADVLGFGEIEEDDGIVLDAGREFRLKLYMGQVQMGWAWFIPIFHMSAAGISQIHLQRSDFDFPLGPGAWIVDADISLVWAPEEEGSSPPARQTSAESQQGIGGEPPVTRLAAVVDAATGGVEGLAKAGGAAQAEE